VVHKTVQRPAFMVTVNRRSYSITGKHSTPHGVSYADQVRRSIS